MVSFDTNNTVLKLSISVTKEKDFRNNHNKDKLKEEEHTNNRDDKSNDDATETMAGANDNTDHGKGEEVMEKSDNDNMRKPSVTNREDVNNDDNDNNNAQSKERDNTKLE